MGPFRAGELMATGTAEPTPLAPPVQLPDAARFDRYIESQLDKTRSQVKIVDFFSSLMLLAAGVLGFLLLAALVDAWIFDLRLVGRGLALVVLLGGIGWFVAARLFPLVYRKINPAYAARVIEQSQPTLKNSIINFLLLRSSRASVHELIYQAVEERAAADLSHVAVDHAVDRTRLIKLGYVLAGIVFACAIYKVVSPKDPFQTVARVLVPWSGVSRPSRVDIEYVRPGDAEVFHGQTLKVSAKVVGARSNDRVLLVFSTVDGQIAERAIHLRPDAEGLAYEGVLTPGDGGIQQDIRYRVAVFDRSVSESQLAIATPIAASQRFHVHVLPAPTITVQSVQYVYPAYTKRPVPPPQKHGDLEALEGTKVTITASANMPIKNAYVEFDPAPKSSLASGGRKPAGTAAESKKSEVLAMQAEGQEAKATFILELGPDRVTPKYKTYQLRFITAEGHQNEEPILHRIAVTRDLPPEIEIITPKEDRIEVREDAKQNIEIRALDPDFALSKISLRAVSGGSDLLDKALFAEKDGSRGQALVEYEFKPAELGLVAGDEVVYWAVAADNRAAPRTGSPEPNTERTRNYHIKITPAPKEPDAEKKPGEGEKEPKPGEKSKPNEGKPGQGEKNSTKPDKTGEGTKSGESKPGEEGGEKKPGEKSGEGSKSPEKSGEGGKTGGEKKPGEKTGEKQGENAGEVGGEKQGEKTGEKQGESGSGEKSGNSGGEKKPGGQQGGTKSGEQKPGNDSSKNPTGANNDDSSSGQNASNSGKPEQGAGKPGDKPSGSGQETTEGGSQQSEGAPDPSGKPGTENRRPGGPGGEKSQGGQKGENSQTEKREGPLHDGEVIEKINEHAKEQQGGSEGTGSQARSASEGTGQEARSVSEGNKEKQPGQGASGEKQGGEKQPGQGEKQPGGGQSGEKQPGQGEKQGEKESGSGASGEKKPAGSQQGEKQPGGGASGEKQPGEKQGGEKQPGGASGSEQNPEKKPGGGSKSGESGGQQDGGEKKPKGGSGEKSGEQPSGGGEKKNDQSGAGQKSESQGGSPSAQEENRDKEKKAGQSGGGKQGGDEAKSPSQSKKQSSSQGGEGGDRSGGGKQGGGQGANQAGNDSAGGSTPGDQGSGAAQEQGPGQTSGQGGKGPASDNPTGVSGSEQGEGSKIEKGTGKEPGGGAPGKTNAGAKSPGNNSGKPEGNKPGDKGEKPGDPQGKPGEAGAQPGASTGPGESHGQSGSRAPGGGGSNNNLNGGPQPNELPPEEKANLEYARKATDLALEHLRDQKDNPDPKLLDKLGMSKDELARFVQKWEHMKKAAREDAAAKRELDESLRSLGLRSSRDKLRGGGAKNDEVKGLLDQGPRSEPPPAYLEQFNAFKRGTARAEK